MNRLGKRAPGLKPGANGFSLVEVVIALGIIAFTFITLTGLLGMGLANDQKSSQQTVATNIVTSIVTDLRSTPAYSTTGKTSRYGLALPTSAASSSTNPLSGVSPTYLYFDDYQNAIGSPVSTLPSPAPAGAVYLATIYLTNLVSVGPLAVVPATSSSSSSASLTQSTDMARVIVSWPAQTKTVPVGAVDVVTEFRIH